MQSNLVNPKITKDKLLSIEQYNLLKNVNEFLLYTDNILEGLTLLNDLTEDEFCLSFLGVVYEPIDRPIFVFYDESQKVYAIKICGSYKKWALPKEVSEIIDYVDLPDYVFYSLKNQKVILVGENTETASVGNSQWQREGRKLGAARSGVPFIYQTFYSGRDESRDTIREPNSLQVYNHLVYSVRYKTPSFVAYLENNFTNSRTRIRSRADGRVLLSKYVKTILAVDVDPSLLNRKKQIEISFFLHMIDYLKEPKSKDLSAASPQPRLKKDFPPINLNLFEQLISKTEEFAENLVEYIYETDKDKIKKYLFECNLLKFDESKFVRWSTYQERPHICELIGNLKANGGFPKSYMSRTTKIGLANTHLCRSFLINKFPARATEIAAVLSDDCPESVVIPLRIHKRSYGKLTYSPDPESGEIVAFSELFSLDICARKKRPVIGYCIVDTPKNFSIYNKSGTKLYKALAEYVDILIINGKDLILNLPNPKTISHFMPENIIDVNPLATTEEVAVVSAFLNQTAINSNWKLCFIHTHHSSWQQLVIHGINGDIQQKVDIISTKVDMILQRGNKFIIAEGKENVFEIFNDKKIRTAMRESGYYIDKLFGADNKQVDAFIFNMFKLPNCDVEENLRREIDYCVKLINSGNFGEKAYHDEFVIIIVYVDCANHTKFKLLYSPEFDVDLKEQLNTEFGQ